MTFPDNDYLFPPVADSSRLLVGCAREDYSASRIAHAVEDCDAHLLNLNVTSMGALPDADYPVVFDLRVDHRDATSIVRSLERYGYSVLQIQNAPGVDDDTLQQRIDFFIKYFGS